MSISHQLTQLRRAARWHRRGLAALAAAIATLAILAALRPAPPVTASVVVAAKDLPAGHRLSGTDLELSHFPSELVPRNAVPNPDIAIGETLAAPITRRSVLTRASTVSVALTPGAGELLVPVRIADGSVRYREDIVDGIENAPEAFLGLLEGKNFGKLLVRVAS